MGASLSTEGILFYYCFCCVYVALSVEKLTIDYKLMLADSNMSYDMFGFW